MPRSPFWSGVTSRRSGRRRSRTSPSSRSSAPRHGSARAIAALADELVRFDGPDGTTLVRRPRRPPAGRGRACPAAAHGDVGQRPSRLRRSKPGDPAATTAGSSSAERRCPAEPPRRRRGGRGLAPGRRRDRGERVPEALARSPGRARAQRLTISSRSSPTVTRRSTAATAAGGPRCRAPRSGSCRGSSPGSGAAKISIEPSGIGGTQER